MNPRVEAAARSFVDGIVPMYGLLSALARARRLRFEPTYRRRPQWLERAIAIMEHDLATRISARFVASLREDLTQTEWIEMLIRNAEETNMLVCHSHDFCDANMVMADAFEHVMEREPDVGDDADAALWSAAWTLAMPHLTAPKNGAAQ